MIRHILRCVNPCGSINGLHSYFPILTLTPTTWHINHRYHHAVSGNASREDWSESVFYTLQQYQQLSLAKRWIYRLTRDPLFFFLAGPPLNWFVIQRLPINLGLANSYKPRVWNTLAGVVWFTLMYAIGGWLAVLALFFQYWLGGF